MNLAKVQRVIVVLFVASFLLGCQSAAPGSESKASAPSNTSSEKPAAANSAEKAAPAEKKSEPAAVQKAPEKSGAVPTSLPKASQDYLAKLKKDPSVLAGLDDELTVPQEWIDAAKKEGKLSILHTIDPPQAEVLLKPFKERYPFIQVDYNRGAQEEKMKAVVSAQSGRPTTDVIIGVGGMFFIMKENNLNLDLRDLTTWKNVPTGFKDEGGLWAGIHIRHWAMAYNTNKVKEQDLPKTWDDLLTNPRWRNGNLALGNRSELWPLPLWREKGEQWVKDYYTKLFTEVKPQLRKESMNAMLDLLGAGEFDAIVPAAEYRTFQNVQDGAPVSWWAPEPIPLASSEMVILKNSSHANAGRLFANWLLSKEGQMAQYVSDFAPPVHKDMRNAEWLPFADKIMGKKTALRFPEDAEAVQPKVQQFWDDLWLKGTTKGR